MNENAKTIAAGETALGIELGSTRIKAVLVDLDGKVLATGGFDWENQFVDRTWTYPLDLVWRGLAGAYRSLADNVRADFGAPLTGVGAIGISAMMHGYLVFDADGDQLVPFRTWRNNMTKPAADALTEAFQFNIPQRWCVAHLAQAIMDGEPHVGEIDYLTSLTGLVHWKLTGRKVVGVGDASGILPIDPATAQFDAAMLARFDALFADARPGWKIADILPEVLRAGQDAGRLTAAGALLLDPTGALRPGIPLAPPEGDGTTSMVATNSVSPRRGNTSVGTSIFTMVVMERPLRRVHPEIDIINTPVGDPVAMVQCNNGASEVSAWAGLFAEFAAALGADVATSAVFDTLLTASLAGDPDCGGLLSYNYLAGEAIAGLSEGRPLFFRTPDSRFTLANFIRSQLYAVFATMALGVRTWDDEQIRLDSMLAHGGLFRTERVAQRLLAAVLDTPVAVAETAGDGGAWGMALLAAYRVAGAGRTLGDYLDETVFGHASVRVIEPDPVEVAGFREHLRRYERALPVMRAAVANS